MKRGILVRIEKSEFAYFDGMHSVRQMLAESLPLRAVGDEPGVCCVSHTTRELPVHVLHKSRYRLEDHNGRPKLDIEGMPIYDTDETYLAVEPEVLSLLNELSKEERLYLLKEINNKETSLREVRSRVSLLLSVVAAFNALPWYKKLWAVITKKEVCNERH